MIRVDMPGSERPSSPASNACVVASCGRKVYGHGYCNAHYQRWKRSGDPQPDIPIRKVGATIEERFWPKVNKGSGCWEWLGYRHPFGHGMLNIDGIPRYAHRISLELHGVEIPAGYEVDHICMNPPCVRPDHLRVATRKQNEENKPMRRDSESGFRGVSRGFNGKGWRAHVTHNGQTYWLGTFGTREEAGAAAQAERNRLFTHNNDDRRTVA